MYLRCILVIQMLCFAISIHAHAQVSGNSKISGKVVDAESGEPLAGVHVFLSSRLQGSTTDAEGNYQLVEITPGSYKVVVSIIGYVSTSQEVQVREFQNVRMNIPLEAIVYELDGVEVTDSQPKDWEKQLNEFTERFLGDSGNAKESEILNPFVLSFEDNGTLFQAYASEPLEIVNNSLGYRMTFVLDHFLYNSSEDKSYTYGTWYFEEMVPDNKGELQEWESRREISFKGSLQHLLWAMVNNRAETEGFSILRDFSKDSAGPELFLHKYHPVDVDDIISETERTYEFEMSFDDFIRVYYLRSGDKNRIFRKVLIPTEQLSYLKTTGEKIIVHESGYMYGNKAGSGNLLVFGHLSSLGVADLLPQEYALMRSESMINN